MKLKIPEESIPPHLVRPHYSMVMKKHRHYNKMHTRQELSYTMYVVLFFTAFIGFIIMEGKGFINNYFVAVSFTGFGILFAFVLSSRFISSEIDKNRLICEQLGKKLEEGYPSLISSSYFKMIDKLTAKEYRITIFSRITLFALVGISMAHSAVILSISKSPYLAVLVGVIVSIALIKAMLFLARNIKTYQKVKI